jgi:chemotaxis protein methyltransferase WspC
LVAASDESLLAHARKLADAGKLPEAASACHEFLAQQPESAEAYFILSLLAESAARPADAETHLKRCLYLQPDHYEALCHLALLQEQGGNSSAAATLKARAARAFQRQQPQ